LEADRRLGTIVTKHRVLPPVYFLAAIVLMALLHWLVPLHRWHFEPLRWFGGLIVVAGLALTIRSARLFARHKTAIRPFDESSTLVVDGPYRFTRNPMYVGLTTILVGLGLVLESVSPFVVVPIFAWIIATRFIAIEERMLGERFGAVYTDYRARVRRWL
jgi:protein-S-isoprenylcysteine O-methyltransferase Ste14